MVKLPGPNDQPARAVGERGSVRSGPPRRYSRFRRRRPGDMTGLVEPSGLQELEAQTLKMVEVMEKYPFNPSSEANFVKVMDLLRLQYNLNFIIVCEKCGGRHYCRNDELVAPER
ncbi:hypothetical protein evm_005976 [Chilo suppressalis]|nr:hypothetical protein evm_005976 [Chilo suppressalis]